MNKLAQPYKQLEGLDGEITSAEGFSIRKQVKWLFNNFWNSRFDRLPYIKIEASTNSSVFEPEFCNWKPVKAEAKITCPNCNKRFWVQTRPRDLGINSDEDCARAINEVVEEILDRHTCIKCGVVFEVPSPDKQELRGKISRLCFWLKKGRNFRSKNVTMIVNRPIAPGRSPSNFVYD